MTIEPEEYVSLNQTEIENPSTVSFLQDNYEILKNRIQTVGIRVCGILFLILNLTEAIVGLILIKHCFDDKYAPAFFIVAGLVGFIPKVTNLVLRKDRLRPKVHRIFYLFYIFEFVWLMVGTYFYVLTDKFKTGCTKSAYAVVFWLIISNYVCLLITLLVFFWVLTLIFVLVYFKNKIIQFLAKSINI